jgi:hypothetical protein
MSGRNPTMAAANDWLTTGATRKEIPGYRGTALGCAKGWVPAMAGLAALLYPGSVLACAACYGQSDSAMAAGMNWGIFSLLGTIVFVLGGVAGSFWFLARRAAAMRKNQEAPVSPSYGMSPAETAARLETEPLTARGGFARVSALAQKRKSCAHTFQEPGHAAAARGRN